MRELESYIQNAMDRSASEIMITPDAPVRARVGKNWVQITEKISVPKAKNELLGLLSEEEKSTLNQDCYVEGGLVIHTQKVHYRMSLGQQGYVGHFSWIEKKSIQSDKWDFPIYMSENLASGQGLHLIFGPRHSGKSSAVGHLVTLALQKKNCLVALFSDKDELQVDEQNGRYSSFDAEILLKNISIAKPYDLVVIDSDNLDVQKKAFELADSGASVLLAVPAPGLRSGVEKFADLVGGFARLAHTLQWAMSLKLVAALDGEVTPCFDLLLVNQQVQQSLRLGLLEEVDSIIARSGDKTGMRTMNQSLLNMIIKRKVELKTAFQASNNPTELDEMLKKIGF